jgi:hypothetical protein
VNDFIDRQAELSELNQILQLQRPNQGEFIIVYGRRRVGKTTLLLHWAEQSNRPTLYWVARRETAEATRQSLARALWRWAYADADQPQPPQFHTWEQLFEQMARMLAGQPAILIFDEFPYAVESDPSLPSHLQAAWDHLLKEQNIVLVLSGSHISMMVDLLDAHAPLYGRFTAQLSLSPLPFAALPDFFPTYAPDELVAAYAVIGGVAGYLERFHPDLSLSDNIRRHLFQRMGMFRSEPTLLISDLVRETRNYEATLRAIAGGDRTPADVSRTTGIRSPNLAPYLKRLQELGLVERRIPATLPPEKRRVTTRSRYHLADPYLRFYFRFIEPNLEMIELGRADLLWERIAEQFRAFVGLTAFEELCREWTRVMAPHTLSFLPEMVGSHWSSDSQVDVVAVNWRDKAILLGECKWGRDPINRSVVRALLKKTPLVIPGEGWQIHYAFYGRAGFTDAAASLATANNATLVDLQRLYHDLRRELTMD